MDDGYNIKNLEKMIIEKSCKIGLLENEIREQTLEIEKLKKILHELVYEKLEIKPTDEKVTKLNEIYTRLLRREIDVGGLLNFYPKIKNNEMSFDELEEHIRNSNEFIVTEKSPTSKTEFNYYSPDMKN
ncbi:MAG: hypothetical protein CMO14_02020 [Thaumarchaeota archaeon]|jgi:hypothetical protein|nr:hypothetical protein [Nitrososphaerota archaeon]|tara:strand:- start:28 stop:414 length:387 start_codon:yes stop_codon:yes gene_type:complete